MARRAKSLNNNAASQDAAPAEMAEPAPVETPVATRGRGKRGAAPSAPAEPAKARRVRRPRSIELAAETVGADDERAEEVAEPVTETHAAEEPVPEQAAPVSDEAPASPSAAQWDAATGRVTFDWPAIEQVAASGGANQAMAKLLLAARAEGANSRWPF